MPCSKTVRLGCVMPSSKTVRVCCVMSCSKATRLHDVMPCSKVMRLHFAILCLETVRQHYVMLGSTTHAATQPVPSGKRVNKASQDSDIIHSHQDCPALQLFFK